MAMRDPTMLRRLFLAMVLALSLPAQATLPAQVRETAGLTAADWRAVGRGELRWFGLSVYEAALWVPGDRFDRSQPFALALTYARAIPRERLVSTSVSEMRRLGWSDEAQLARWQDELERVFPDVREGDTIVGVSVPGRGARFFHQGRATGEVADAEFARAFFAIWLDERTRVPELRAQLLRGS